MGIFEECFTVVVNPAQVEHCGTLARARRRGCLYRPAIDSGVLSDHPHGRTGSVGSMVANADTMGDRLERSQNDPTLQISGELRCKPKRASVNRCVAVIPLPSVSRITPVARQTQLSLFQRCLLSIGELTVPLGDGVQESDAGSFPGESGCLDNSTVQSPLTMRSRHNVSKPVIMERPDLHISVLKTCT